MLEIFKSTLAKQDLIEIYAYLFSEAGEETAERFVEAVENAFADLALMPGMGTLAKPTRNGDVRFAIIPTVQ